MKNGTLSHYNISTQIGRKNDNISIVISLEFSVCGAHTRSENKNQTQKQNKKNFNQNTLPYQNRKLFHSTAASIPTLVY